MLGHGIKLKLLHINWRHPDGRYKSEFLQKVRDKVEYHVQNLVSTPKHKIICDETMVRWV